MSASSTLEQAAKAVIGALEPLSRAFSSVDSFKAFMRRLGWDTAGLPPAYLALGDAVNEAVQALNALRDEPTAEEIGALILKAKSAYTAARTIQTAPPGVDAAAFAGEIGERLFEILWTDYLALHQPALFNLLSMLDVITTDDVLATAQRPGYVRTRFKWNELPTIISDPLSLPERVYGWGTPQLNFPLLAQHFGELLFALDFPVVVGKAGRLLTEAYADDEVGVDEEVWALKVPFYYITIAEKNLEASFRLLEKKGTDAALPGLVIEPQIPEEFPLTLHLAPTIDLRIRAGTNAASQLGVVIRPDDASITYPFEPGTVSPSAGVGLGFDFNPTTPTLLFGSSNATRLEFQGASVDFGASMIDGELDILLSAQLKRLALVLAPGDGDSFLRTMLGDGERRFEIPVGIEWSRRNGLHFNGSTAFEAAVYPRQRIGPITLDGIALRLCAPSDHSADLSLAVGAQLSGQLGPVSFAVEGLGFLVDARFSPGNVGPFDLQLGFKPPTGLGLAIDATVVQGGGFLSFDRDKAQYAGAVYLEITGGLTITALGLLTTRLPDGTKGFSLVVVLTAEGFQPIPLGFGFLLTGIGGLVGIHRTVNEGALQAGGRNHSLNAVLTPDDPVRHAPQYLSALNTIFPPARDHYLFGPVVQVTWGAPTLVTINLALVFEFGARTRFFLLGTLSAVLPKPDLDLVRLQMNVAGGIDFDQQRAFLDAALYDSRLLNKFVITGEMRMRMSWSDRPFFALAVGGLHPAFTPPPGLDQMQRTAIVFADADDLKIRCEAYFALTSNTVQFGARVDLFARASKFSVIGQAGFDVLVQFNPFSFIASLYASLQLKCGSRNLFKVKFEGELSGPRPLHARGKATFEILWWDYSVSFNRTLISGERPPLPPVTDVAALLRQALTSPAGWSTTAPGAGERLVSLRDRSGTPTAIPIHPLSRLTLTQKVVPLNVQITRFGNSPILGGPQEFRIGQVTVGTSAATTEPVRDHFAPAQFRDLSDDEKLSSPSFELLEAGVQIGAEPPDCGSTVTAIVEYEEILIPEPMPPDPAVPGRRRLGLDAGVAGRFAHWSAVGLRSTSKQGATAYRGPAVALATPSRTYRVVSQRDLTMRGIMTDFSTRTEAIDALRALTGDRREGLQIIAVRQ